VADPRRVVRAAVVGIWTAVFAWLWIDDAATIYVGPRTAWIVPAGTIALAVCTAAALFGAFRSGNGPRPSLRELAGYAVLLLPVAAVLVVDSPRLGANAADRKGDIELSVDDLPAADGALDLEAFAVASDDPEIAEKLGLDKSGRAVAFPGMITRQDGSTLDLTRFRIYCCAADAVPYTATIEDPSGLAGDLAINDWAFVRGKVHRAPDGTLTVRPQTLEPVEAPLNPYL
jgi:uncharacterized repeat protein (TIGR03943 family)